MDLSSSSIGLESSYSLDSMVAEVHFGGWIKLEVGGRIKG